MAILQQNTLNTNKMKAKICYLLTLLLNVITVFSQEFVIIDSDYSKIFPVNHIVFDSNLDGKLDAETETFTIEKGSGSNIFVDYKDFGSAGNMLSFKIDLKGKGLNKKFVGNVENITYARKANNNEYLYLVRDRFDENLLSITITEKKRFLL